MNTPTKSTSPRRGKAAQEIPEAAQQGLELPDLVPRFRNDGYEPGQLARRRAWLENKTGATLAHVGQLSFDSEQLRGNVENAIGVAQVPMGIAGPLLVRGQHAQGTFYVPMATSEGALIRSYERGMAVLTRSGGVQVALLGDENHISPGFFFDDISAASSFVEWVPKNFAAMQTEGRFPPPPRKHPRGQWFFS